MNKKIERKVISNGLFYIDDPDAYLLSYYDDTLAMLQGRIEVVETYSDFPVITWDYSVSVLVVYGFVSRLLPDKRRKPGYRYLPDQRPYTFRLLGKPSQGPSPPARLLLNYYQPWPMGKNS